MNATRTLLAIVITTFGVGAFAQEATSDAWMSASSTESRSTVQQELRQAQRDGTIQGEAYNFVATPSVVSREDVRAGLVASKHSGEFGILHAEVYGFPRS
jgi:hypothetical protein